ncbi:host attachment protein [Thiorhodococcus mannitoliphagus]|uniref:Host attachment protein n=1 Tax=Thiorhodococcus mannitoliphagus TaxID=329406 RepID=A0A6P1DYI6_9GAMM|nr:host attachment protein [Thiorhodococcus mannitoliphagus]NEX22749.1 host attachment protein [Thiorhodococcus mannitoliphagus]
MPTWILVADNSRARIFTAEKAAGPLTEVSSMAFPEGRLHSGDLISDKGGRGQTPAAGAHGVNGEDDHKQENADRFASLLCEDLESARNEGRFSKLYVVASPALLGLLRKHQSASLKQLIAGELDKNLTTQPPETIRKHLPDFL